MVISDCQDRCFPSGVVSAICNAHLGSGVKSATIRYLLLAAVFGLAGTSHSQFFLADETVKGLQCFSVYLPYGANYY
ncbi:hypothetical protein M2350_002108 [Candidatus Fervidibacter sacchari]|uniref:Uncharacterized protein n=1 Tax=Candidatus Fervidibacter sacchari TaxID=1448929 RepID=A0ABT2EPB2_9BACT|nr:hypothetical protein [Candidatus Fervidibacter sacchari]